jgi:hypothetical protein
LGHRTTCLRCGVPLPIVAQKHKDDYCSVRCVHEAFGVQDRFSSGSEAQQEAARRNGQRRRQAAREQERERGFRVPVAVEVPVTVENTGEGARELAAV